MELSLCFERTSRGFGLALVRQLASLPASDVSKVFVGARGDSTALEDLTKSSPGRVVIIKLDDTNELSVKQAAAEVEPQLEGKGLDVSINNSRLCQYAPDGVKSTDDLVESFTINVLGVHWVTRALLPLLQKDILKKVAKILARAAHSLPAPAYKISKAAMNSFTVQYALHYEKEGFSFIALCPGMKTDLGGDDMADLTPEEAAKASLDITFKPGLEYNGQMPKVLVKGWKKAEGNSQYDGTNVPW